MKKGLTREDILNAAKCLFTKDSENYFPVKIERELTEDNIKKYLSGEISAEELLLTRQGNIKVTFTDDGK